MSDDGFQPFGYRFELLSKLPPDQLKAKIKSRLKGWFEMKPAARGWMAGSVICLWNEAFRRGGPVLVARIETNTFGSAIVGRAGFSLLMAVLAALALPVAVLLTFALLSRADGSIQSLLLPVIFVGLPVALLWTSHAYRHEADPLVRFLERLDQPPTSRKRKTWGRPVGRFDHLTLSVDGKEQPKPVTAEMIENALDGLEASGFLIIASADETYMQVAEVDEEFIIETRDGDERSHVRAVYADGRSGHESDVGTTFSAEVTLEALLAYAAEMPPPSILAWRPL